MRSARINADGGFTEYTTADAPNCIENTRNGIIGTEEDDTLNSPVSTCPLLKTYSKFNSDDGIVSGDIATIGII